jgi:DNA polymerase III subunit gamma/tau
MVLLRFLAFPPAGTTRPGPATGGTSGDGERSSGAAGSSGAPVAMSAPAPASAAARAAQEAAEKARTRAAVRPAEPDRDPDDDGPPPWMDEAPPFEAFEAANVPTDQRSEPIALPAAPAPSAVVSCQRTALGDVWADTAAALNQAGLVSALVRELVMQAELVGAEAQCWTLRVERDSLRTAALMDKLQAALRQLPGHEARVLAVQAGVATDSPALRDAEAARQRQADAEAAFRADPLVLAALQQFAGARIVPGSVRPH